jgi:hypothetical protein
MLMEGWAWIESLGYSEACFRSGDPHPLYDLRNKQTRSFELLS